MKVSVKFNKEDRPEFVKELRDRVNLYFETNNISKKANVNMKVKTVFMLCLYFIPGILMLTGIVSSLIPVLMMWFIMGFGMSGIGLSIMHDANHGSYSNKKWVNNLFGYLLNFVGGYHKNWKIQHNVLHHSYTNIEGYDEDIENPIMRFSPHQPNKSIYKYQVFYAPFIYGLLTIYWFLTKDFVQLYKYHKLNLLSSQGVTLSKAVFQVIYNKLGYLVLTILLPLYLIDLPWWQILLGFLMMHFISGLILALIFQPAHVLEETSFFDPELSANLKNNSTIHQLMTTANFANGSVWFSWFIGGLNYQIEHHLFPNICHVHYRNLSPIVKATAEEYGIKYNRHKTFFGAVKSHFTLINKLGTGEYDRQLNTSN